MRNTFLKKLYTKYAGKGPFIKFEIEHISGAIVWNVLRFVFIVSPSQGLPKYIKTW